MLPVDFLHQRAGRGAKAPGRVVSVFVIAPRVADLVIGKQRVVTLREPLAAIARQHDAPRRRLHAVAGDAVLVPYRLDVARIVDHFGHAGNRLDLARRAVQRHQRAAGRRRGGPRAGFVAADATLGLAGHDHRVALHPLDRQPLVVQRHEEQGAESGNLKRSRPVGLDGDGSQDAMERVCSVHADRARQRVVADRLGEVLEHEEALDFAGLDSRHVASVVDVGQDELPRALLEVRAGGNHPLAEPRADHARIVDHLIGPVDLLQRSVAIEDHEALVFGDKKTVFAERVRVAEAVAAAGHAHIPQAPAGADLPEGRPIVRPGVGIEDLHVPGVLAKPVPRREDGHDMVAAGDRQGVDHHEELVFRRDGVAEQEHLVAAVGVHRPQAMEFLRGAVDVIPPGVKDSAAGQHRRPVIADVVGRKGADVAAGVHVVQAAGLRVVAGHEAVAAAGDEHDPAAGQIVRLDVIPIAGSQLPQAAPVGVDFVEVGVLRAALAV